MSQVRVLASGIDSLYASVRGELVDGLLQVLAELRRANPDADVPLSLHSSGSDTMLRRYGWRGYPFWLSSPRYEIAVGARDPFPTVYLQLHAEHIHSVGIERAVYEAEAMLVDDLFPRGCRAIASRVDVFVDEQGWTPERDDFANFRCRALRRRMFEMPRQEHGYGRHLTGFTFGKGDLVARIYDKTRETIVSGHTWPELLWEGRDPDRAVWRVEFQFRRAILVALGLTGMSDVVRRRQGLWHFGTRWLTLRAPIRDSNRARWPIAPAWAQLTGACIGGSAVPLIRETIRAADLERLTQGLVGYASSIEAMDGAQDLGQALATSVPTVRPYLAHRAASFGDLVAAKRQNRLEATR
jgi:hypothetical protein